MACKLKEVIDELKEALGRRRIESSKKLVKGLISRMEALATKSGKIDIREASKIEKIKLPSIATTPAINVWSMDNNGYEGLSNVNTGVVEAKGLKFATVEGMFQYSKAIFAGDMETANKILNLNYSKYGKNEVRWNDKKQTGLDKNLPSGVAAQKLGQKVQGLDKEAWGKVAEEKLYQSMKMYYKQNTEAAQKLIDTGEARITHKAYGKEQDGGRFSRLLMKIRGELKKDGVEMQKSTTTEEKSIVEQIKEVNKGKPADKHTSKEIKKAEIATQYIGKGSPNSSTARYANVYGDKANTGKYTKDDVIWVSSNGKRNGRIDPLGANGIKKLLDKAIEAEATIVMDTEEHINKTSKYNIGEVALASYMTEQGYIRDSSSGAGIWTKKESKVEVQEESQNKPLETYPKLTDFTKEVRRAIDGVKGVENIERLDKKWRELVDKGNITKKELERVILEDTKPKDIIIGTVKSDNAKTITGC